MISPMNLTTAMFYYGIAHKNTHTMSTYPTHHPCSQVHVNRNVVVGGCDSLTLDSNSILHNTKPDFQRLNAKKKITNYFKHNNYQICNFKQSNFSKLPIQSDTRKYGARLIHHQITSAIFYASHRRVSTQTHLHTLLPSIVFHRNTNWHCVYRHSIVA